MSGKMKIGVLADGFRLPIKEGIKKAAELGVTGVQLYAVSGETAPWNMDAQARAELRKVVADNGIVVSAVCGDLWGYGFTNPNENPERIEKSKQIIDLSLELGCKIITTHGGVIPEDETHPRHLNIKAAFEAIGSYAQKAGAVLAIETGPEPAAVLRSFLDKLETRGVAVNLDPANLIMSVDDDPVKAVETLKPYVVHTHAKDGILLRKVDPTYMYHTYGVEPPADLPDEWDICREMPLGEGGVDWDNYLAALKNIGYTGYLTIEREVGEDPARDIGMAVEFLKRKLELLY
ncbi:MAG: sugar phosphate isomerase/epimerase [Oscillospiraceae bacterium]|nr:sugar phosphate isomerase/epimerase [Oscillospiraceae bacterium]